MQAESLYNNDTLPTYRVKNTYFFNLAVDIHYFYFHKLLVFGIFEILQTVMQFF